VIIDVNSGDTNIPSVADGFTLFDITGNITHNVTGAQITFVDPPGLPERIDLRFTPGAANMWWNGQKTINFGGPSTTSGGSKRL
jgi:hypothetical protein